MAPGQRVEDGAAAPAPSGSPAGHLSTTRRAPERPAPQEQAATAPPKTRLHQKQQEQQQQPLPPAQPARQADDIAALRKLLPPLPPEDEE
jgi:hypothetical protein